MILGSRSERSFQPGVFHHFIQSFLADFFVMPFDHHDPLAVAPEVMMGSVVAEPETLFFDFPDKLRRPQSPITFFTVNIISLILRNVMRFI
jgi:hypothetical protein